MLCGPDPRRGRRAGRPARRRHPGPRARVPQATSVPAARPGLGLHRHLRQAERRRLPHRPLPGRRARRSGTSRAGRHVAAHPRRVVSPAIIARRAVRLRTRRPSCSPRWNRRERALIATDPDRVPPLALPPLPDDAVLGHADRGRRWPASPPRPRAPSRRASTAATSTSRTCPIGSRVFYPVYVPGAKFSDRRPALLPGRRRDHASAAPSRWAASSTSTSTSSRAAMEKYSVTTNPIFQPGTSEPRYSEFVSFIGISVDEAGTSTTWTPRSPTATPASTPSSTCKKFGYTGEQAYLILGAAPIEGRVSGVVDIPNACCSLYLPTGDLRRRHPAVRRRARRQDRGSARGELMTHLRPGRTVPSSSTSATSSSRAARRCARPGSPTRPTGR